MVLQNISSNRLFFIVSISTALSTVLWTLSTSSTSTSTASTIALCTSILGYLLFQHQHRSLLNHRYQRRKQRDGTEDVSVILPDYISIERLGRVVSNREATPQAFGWRSSPPLSAITDSKSEPQQQPHSSSTPSNAPPFFTRQHQHGQNVRGNPDPEQLKQSQAMTNNSCSPLDVLTKETLEAIGAHLDYRIWDHIVVGEGYEALQDACRLAQQNPTKTVLVVLKDDLRQSTMERVVQWMQKRLSAQAQRLWAREASRAVFGTYQDSISLPPTPNNTLSVMATTLVDLAALPTNLCISPNLQATRILVDKPITAQAAVTPTSKSARRFSSNKYEPPNNLTINIAPLTPSRAVGLEVVSIQESTGRARLFCRNSVIFASDKHRLVRSIDATITPPMSRDSPVGRRPPLTNVEDSGHWSRMVFSINMQHIRQTGSRTSIQEQLLTSIANTLDRFSEKRYPSQVQGRILDLSPVLLHQSDCVVEHGRVRPTLPEDDISETFRLEISVATASLQATSPIQLQVKVVTQPVVQDAFGNTSMIRMGEAVLVEGLVLAREMAKVAGWTCLEDDDSQMVEWVRDQMDIQWDHAPVSQAATSIPACYSVEGVQAYTRSRTPSGTSSRVRTPSLSPYPSRTHSYRAKRQDDHGEKRDSTLAQLQEVSENLQAHESKKSANEDKLRVPTVAKVTVEGSSPTQRSGFRASFGFSSLKDSRMQCLALDAETEDLLGVAPSKGSPLVGTSSPRECSRQDPVGLFDEGIGSFDSQSHGSSSLTSSPEPRKLSRFSIKSYQLELERSNHGLNDWGIGNLDMNVGKKTSTTTTVTNDLLSTPPLIADLGLPGTVSPLTPSPEQLPGTDFLHGLNISVGEEPPAHQVGRSLYSNELNHLEDGRENVSNTFLNSHTIDNGGRKKFGSFSIHNRHHNDDGNDSNNTVSNENAQKTPSPLEPPAELIHDFLGESLAISPKPSNTSRFRSDSVNRSSLERASSDSGVGSSKAVHFADCESGSMMQRVHSEPNSHMMRRDSTSLLDSSLSGLAEVSSPASFKSKAHTRRSWGKGIGGSDISGIQGLSE